MSAVSHDDVRAAAALLACTARGPRADHLLAVIFDDHDTGQLAAIAAVLLGITLIGAILRTREAAALRAGRGRCTRSWTGITSG
jgi:hypothetical protein